MSVSAYRKTIKETETPRKIEQRVFSKITGDLERIPHNDKGLYTDEQKNALWENQRLWMALRSDLVLPDNNLPTELRAQLISLGMWVDNHTVKVLKGEALISDLVEINRSIIGGLEK